MGREENNMEYLGIFAFILVIFNMELPDKVRKLKDDVRIIKNAIKGEGKMSEILKELEGKRCKLEVQGSFQGPIECDVINVDDEWIKISQISKKNQSKIKLIRIDRINEVSLL